MVRPGIVYGNKNGANEIVSQVSLWSESISPDRITNLLEVFLKEAEEEMKGYIRTRGVNGGVRNSEGRIRSSRMIKSTGSAIDLIDANRVRGRFGFLKDPPKWALWQEYGTKGGQGNGQGIKEMLALTDAYQNFERKIEDLFDNGRILNYKGGGYRRNMGTYGLD